MSFSFFHTPQQQQPQQMILFTKDGTPASYNTLCKDLHPHSQALLLHIEKHVMEYRNDSERVDQSSRLYEYSVSNDGFMSDSKYIVQVLCGITSAMPKNLQELASTAKNISLNTNMAVSTFKNIRPMFHYSEENAMSNTDPAQTIGVTTTPTSVHWPYFYHGPKKPSLFLCETISRFEKCLSECRQWIEEFEPLLKISERRTSSDGSLSLESLPKVMENIHRVFIHVTAKVESIHQHTIDIKSTHQVKNRHRQENDPSQVPEWSRTTKRLLARLPSSGKMWTSYAPQTSSLTPSSLGSGLPAFSMPSSVPSPSLFVPQLNSTPIPSVPSPSLFVPQPTSTPITPFPGVSNVTPQTLFFNSAPVWASAGPQTCSLASNSSGSGLSNFSMPSSSVQFSPSLFETPPPSAPVSRLRRSSSSKLQTPVSDSPSTPSVGFSIPKFDLSSASLNTTSGLPPTPSTPSSSGDSPGTRPGVRSKSRRFIVRYD